MFRLLPLGVATAAVPPPFGSIICILLRHFNHCHVLSHRILLRHFNHCHVLPHRIHKPPFRPTPFPLSWQLLPRHPSPNIPVIFPPYMSIPPQAHLSCFIPKPSHLRRPSNLLIPDTGCVLSILVTANEKRNIFNSATSISASCLFVSATISDPYNIAGLTATLYTFLPLSLVLAYLWFHSNLVKCLIDSKHPHLSLYHAYL